MDNAASFWDIVVESWKGALEEVIRQLPSSPPQTPWGKECFAGIGERMQAKDAVPKLVITEVCEMLQVGISPFCDLVLYFYSESTRYRDCLILIASASLRIWQPLKL
jgi:hypothetical protein